MAKKAKHRSQSDHAKFDGNSHTSAEKPTVLDLFSGAGGTGLGFAAVGFEIVGAIEINENAAKTYRRNLNVKVNRDDIDNIDAQRFRRDLGLDRGQLTVMVGCPPCQGFSRMRNENGVEDKRNRLVLRYAAFVKEFMPRYAIFENVPGLWRTQHGKQLYGELRTLINELGYQIQEQVVEVADFGVPQHRKRVIVIAAARKLSLPYLSPTHSNPEKITTDKSRLKPWMTVREAIRRYPPLVAGQNGEANGTYPNHIASKTGEKVLEFIRQVPPNGGSRTDVVEEHWLRCHIEHRGHKDVYGRVAWDRPANTITSGCTNPSKGRFVHPEQDRAITPREAAALQGFPDSFVFEGRSIPSQIGNAVPPPLAGAIASSIRECLKLD